MTLRLENGNIVLEINDIKSNKYFSDILKNKKSLLGRVMDIFFVDEFEEKTVMENMDTFFENISYKFGDLISFKYDENEHKIIFKTRLSKKTYEFEVNICKEIYENSEYMREIYDFDKEFVEFNKYLTEEKYSEFTKKGIDLIKRKIVLDQYNVEFKYRNDELNKKFLQFLQFRRNELIQNKILRKMENSDLLKSLHVMFTAGVFVFAFSQELNLVIIALLICYMVSYVKINLLPASSYDNVNEGNALKFVNNLIQDLKDKVLNKEQTKMETEEFTKKVTACEKDRLLEFIAKDEEICERFKLFVKLDEEKKALYDLEHNYVDYQNHGSFDGEIGLDNRYKALKILNTIEQKIQLKTLPFRIDTDEPILNEDGLYDRLIWLGVDDFVIESDSNIKLLIELISKSIQKPKSDEIVNRLFEELLKLCYLNMKNEVHELGMDPKEVDSSLNLLPINKD